MTFSGRQTSVKRRTLYLTAGKRLLDLAASLAGLVVLSPLLLLLAIAVKLSSRGPAIFRQTRVGQGEKEFEICKFRTMRMENGGALVTAAGDSRITRVGNWLRKTKLDELPQLYNVLRGDMSLVGPRPEVPFYTARYSDWQKAVFAARPGITGPSIIMDEEELMASHEDKEAFYLSTIMPAKLEIDVAYARDIRFSSDMRLIWATFQRLFASRFGRALGVEAGHHLGLHLSDISTLSEGAQRRSPQDDKRQATLLSSQCNETITKHVVVSSYPTKRLRNP